MYASFITALFCVFIFGFGAALLISPDQDFSQQENRYLAKFEAPTLSTLKSGEFMKDFEQYVIDQFPLRDGWIQLKAWCERLVGRVNGARPDLILFTGDQADGPLALRRGDLEPLGGLRAPEGAFLITGNHEHYFETEAYLRFYEGLGIRVLDGRTATVRGLGLMGLPDRRSLTRLGDDALRLRGLREALPRGAFPVLLVHKPGIAPEADALGVGLQLSGHTHGGQVPGVALAIRHFNGGFVRGWYTLPRGMRLFVAPGSGVWLGFPYRLYPSEITVLTLRGGGAAGGAKKEKS